MLDTLTNTVTEEQQKLIDIAIERVYSSLLLQNICKKYLGNNSHLYQELKSEVVTILLEMPKSRLLHLSTQESTSKHDGFTGDALLKFAIQIAMFQVSPKNWTSFRKAYYNKEKLVYPDKDYSFIYDNTPHKDDIDLELLYTKELLKVEPLDGDVIFNKIILDNTPITSLLIYMRTNNIKRNPAYAQMRDKNLITESSTKTFYRYKHYIAYIKDWINRGYPNEIYTATTEEIFPKRLQLKTRGNRYTKGKTYKPQLTFEIAEQIRLEFKSGLSNKELAIKYNVPPSSITSIIHYKRFKPEVMPTEPLKVKKIKEKKIRVKYRFSEEMIKNIIEAYKSGMTAKDIKDKFDIASLNSVYLFTRNLRKK